jgi:hypothetical protein
VTASDWKRLRKSARTAEEFSVCEEWCRMQTESCLRQEAQYESELEELRNRPPNREGPRYPPTADQLRTEIAHYKGLARYWSSMAASYEQKAAAAHD